MRFRTKISLLLVFFSIIPVASTVYFQERQGSKILEKQVGESSLEFARMALLRINEYLYEKSIDVQAWGAGLTETHIEPLDDSDSTQVSLYLERSLSLYEDFLYAAILDIDGNVYAATDEKMVGKDMSNLDSFQASLKGDRYVSDVSYDTVANAYSILMTAPIYQRGNKGKIIGVVLGAVKWERLHNMIISQEIDGKHQNELNHVMLINANGLIISCFTANVMFKQNLVEMGLRSAKEATEGKEGYLLEVNEHGNLSFSTYTYAGEYKDLIDLGWGLILHRDTDTVFLPVTHLKEISTIIIVISVLLALILSILTARKVTKGFNEISCAAAAIGDGNLEKRIPIKKKDEIGLLAKSFNKMAEELGRLNKREQSQREELQESNQQLLVGEARFRKLSDAAFEGIAIQQNRRVSDVNQRFVDMFGYTLDELGKMDSIELIAPDSRETVKGHINAGHEGPYEAIGLKKDGSTFPIEVQARAETLAGVTFRVAAIRDVTERKQADKDLIESARSLAMAQQAACVGSWDWDILNDKLTWSDETSRQMGLKPNEIEPTYEVFERFIHPDDREELNEAVRAALEENKPYSIDARMIRKDGTEWIMQTKGIIQRNDDGKAVRFVGTQQDITERKRTEKVLKESEDKYRTLVENIDIVICRIDENGTFLFMNSYGAGQLGGKADDFIGKTMWDLFPKEPADQQVESIRKALRSDKGVIVEERQTVVAGMKRWYEARIWPLENRTVLLIANDISERKQVEAVRESYKEKVAHAQRRAYIGSMGSIVAHQVNQPLTKINILLDRALENAEGMSCNPDNIRDIKESLSQVKEATSIIRRFRQYSKDSAMEGTGKVNVSAVTGRIVSLLSEKAEQANMRISIKDLGDLPAIEANETALEQMFLILIQNAIEAADGRKPHMLDITGKFADCNIELQFSDDCCGIAPENLDRIFEPFFSTKAEDEGMGLGLDIVKVILISCGGQIRVESQPGKGATFYVTLPINNTLGA